MPIVRLFIISMSLLFISACGDPQQAKIEAQIQQVEIQLDKLQHALEKSQVRNANLILEYAKHLREIKPELSGIVGVLEKDGTADGVIFITLQDRFTEVKLNADSFATPELRLEELMNLSQASSKRLYNDVLSDPLNVLADMSQGELARVNSVSKEADLASNKASDFGIGSQLIGNPAYGQWAVGDDGLSFWEWYAIFSLIDDIDDVFDYKRKKKHRLYYNAWSSKRGYSYYNDYGRYRYSSPKQLTKQIKTEQRAKKNFKGNGKFKSAYAKTRTGAVKMSSASRASQTASKRFASSYSKSTYSKKTTTTNKTSTNKSSNKVKKSSYSSNSSFRSSKSGSFRGGFGGK